LEFNRDGTNDNVEGMFDTLTVTAFDMSDNAGTGDGCMTQFGPGRRQNEGRWPAGTARKG